MSAIETVKVVKNNGRTGYAIINAADFDESRHVLYEGEKAPVSKKAAKAKAEEEAAAKAKAEEEAAAKAKAEQEAADMAAALAEKETL